MMIRKQFAIPCWSTNKSVTKMFKTFFFRSFLFFALVSCIAGSSSFAAKQEVGLESAVRQAVQHVIETKKSATLDAIRRSITSRQELERVLTEGLTSRLLFRFRQLDSAMDGSFRIARDFVRSAFRDAAYRARWPKEALVAYLETLAFQAEEQVAELHESVNSPRMSALNLEAIIDGIIQDLLADPTVQSILEWLVTLPAAIHEIADELFAGKTFEEIFGMLPGKGNNMKAMEVLLAEDLLAASSSSASAPAVRPSFLLLARSSLEEARPTISLTLDAYRQLAKDHVGELMELIREEEEALGDKDAVKVIKAAAIRILMD